MPHEISIQVVLAVAVTVLVSTIIAESVKLFFEWLRHRRDTKATKGPEGPL